MISIPPYISTSWDEVVSIGKEGDNLIFELHNGKTVSIPGLDEKTVEEIFDAHASYFEQANEPSESTDQVFTLPLGMSKETIQSLGQSLQHNPALSHLPPLPPEITEKVTALTGMISKEEIELMEEPVMHCNCMYCQITRLLREKILGQELELPDHPDLDADEVSEDELRFDEWKVEPLENKMFKVSRKLKPDEHYTVYLGSPVGCTCGEENCAHVIAVLRS